MEEEQQQGLPPLPAGFEHYVPYQAPTGGVNSSIAAAAQDVLDGKVNPQRFRAMTVGRYAVPGLADEVRRLAAAQGKEYGDDVIQRRFDVLKDYNNTGINKMGGQLAAGNTVIRHAQDFKDLVEASNNGDMRAVNAIRNRLATEMGGTASSELYQIAHTLGGESERAITGGVPTVEGMRQLASILPPSASKEQLTKAADNFIKLNLDKMRSHKDSLEAAGINTKRFPVIKGTVSDILKKNNFDPDALVQYTPEQLGAQAGDRFPGTGSGAGGGYQQGHIYGGLVYLGGDPNVRSSWRPK